MATLSVKCSADRGKPRPGGVGEADLPGGDASRSTDGSRSAGAASAGAYTVRTGGARPCQFRVGRPQPRAQRGGAQYRRWRQRTSMIKSSWPGGTKRNEFGQEASALPSGRSSVRRQPSGPVGLLRPSGFSVGPFIRGDGSPGRGRRWLRREARELGQRPDATALVGRSPIGGEARRPPTRDMGARQPQMWRQRGGEEPGEARQPAWRWRGASAVPAGRPAGPRHDRCGSPDGRWRRCPAAAATTR